MHHSSIQVFTCPLTFHVSSGEVCANLLNSLNYSEILSIMSLKDFNLDILGHCFSFFPASGSGGQTHLVPKSGGSMFNAARDALWQNVKEIVDHLPTPFAIYSPKEHWDPSPNESKYAHRSVKEKKREYALM